MYVCAFMFCGLVRGLGGLVFLCGFVSRFVSLGLCGLVCLCVCVRVCLFEIRGQVCSRLLLKNYLFIFDYLLAFSCG